MGSKTESGAPTPSLREAALSGSFAKPRGARSGILADLRGVSQLVVAAVAGVTDIVEDLHRNIARVSPIVGAAPAGRARGISGWVYRSVRGVTWAVGCGFHVALAPLTPPSSHHGASPRREALVAALNGALGDYLAASNNPLAIPMHLRQQGRPLALERQALATDCAQLGSKLLVLAHGLCMNDLQWRREGRDHGASLAQDLGYTPIYLHYNSGRPIATNGREFAALMARLVREWPVPISELVIIGHSMGGLVSRSAFYHALQADHAWLRHLKKFICLGTPHHGAPLERAGRWVDLFMRISPYTAPFARLGQIRSAGVKDLRYGNFLGEDWERPGETPMPDSRRLVPLPEGVRCYVIAATTQQRQSGGLGWRLPGDGLVPVKSALGQHEDAALTLPIPASRQGICHGLNHFDLLSRREVYDRIHRWLAEG